MIEEVMIEETTEGATIEEVEKIAEAMTEITGETMDPKTDSTITRVVYPHHNFLEDHLR